MLRSVSDISPVPLEPALILHTNDKRSLTLVYPTEKHQREWFYLMAEYIRLAKDAAPQSPKNDNGIPEDVEVEMQYNKLRKDLRRALVDFYEKHAPAKVRWIAFRATSLQKKSTCQQEGFQVVFY